MNFVIGVLDDVNLGNAQGHVLSLFFHSLSFSHCCSETRLHFEYYDFIGVSNELTHVLSQAFLTI